MAFSPVKNDMLGNIKVRRSFPYRLHPSDGASLLNLPRKHADHNPMQKIRERQLAAPAESETLQDLVRNELKTKSHKATEGLLWLVRLVKTKRDATRLQQQEEEAIWSG